MILEAKNISFRYGKDTRQILDHFSLQAQYRMKTDSVVDLFSYRQRVMRE